MFHKDIKEVRDCYAALRELVIHNSGGWDDAASREKVQRLCATGIAALKDEECHSRLRAILSQAAELYSGDGHRKWARASMSGADYLRLQILIALEALNTRLFFVDTQRSRRSVSA